MKQLIRHGLICTIGILVTSCGYISNHQSSPSPTASEDKQATSLQPTQTPQSKQGNTPATPLSTDSPLLQKGYFNEMINGKLPQLGIYIGMTIEDLLASKGKPISIEEKDQKTEYTYPDFKITDFHYSENTAAQVIDEIVLYDSYIGNPTFQQIKEILGFPLYEGESYDTNAYLLTYNYKGYGLCFTSLHYSSEQAFIDYLKIK